MTRCFDWLYGIKGKSGRKPIPVDLVLDLWFLGIASHEILLKLQKETGRNFNPLSMQAVILHARETGDPRAIYRRRANGASDGTMRILRVACRDHCWDKKLKEHPP